MAFTSGNDINILQSTDATNISAGEGDDKYILSGDSIADDQLIIIGDTQGANTLQLVGGLSIASSSVTATAAQIFLSNGAEIRLLSADAFTFLIGGDSLTGAGGTTEDYSTFATNTLGVSAVPAEGEEAVAGTAVEIAGGPSTTEGVTVELTKSSTIPDVPALTTGNDTVTAAAGTLENTDIINDGSADDADVLTASVNSNNLTSRLTNIETVNLNGQYATTGMDLQNVVGTTTLNLSAAITAGTATLTNVSATAVDNIVAGDNIGTLSVTAAAAGTAGTVDVDAGAASTVTVAGGNGNDTFIVDALSASSITLNGGTGTDAITLNLDGGTVSSFDTDASAVDTLTVNSTTAASTLTLADNEVLVGTTTAGSGLIVTGDQDLTISGDLNAIEGVSITDSGSATTTFTVTANTTAASNVSKAAIDVLNLTAAPGAGALVINEGTLLKTSQDINSTSVNIDNAAGNLTTGTLNMEINADQTTLVTGAKVDTLDVVANTNNIAITTLTLDTATNTAVFSGAKNVSVGTVNNATGDVISAEGLTGTFTAANFAASAVVLGGSNNDTITLTNFDDFIVRGGAGNDTITAAAVAGANNATLFGDEGDDSITGSAAADIIDGGAGADFIDSGVGADTLTGGAGADIFFVDTTSNSGDSTDAAYDTITDFSGDVLRFGNDNVAGSASAAATAGATVQISSGGKVTFHANDDTLSKKLIALNADDINVANGEVVFFEHGSDTYVFGAGVSTASATDEFMVKLAGVTDLTTLSESVVTAGDFSLV